MWGKNIEDKNQGDKDPWFFQEEVWNFPLTCGVVWNGMDYEAEKGNPRN